MQPEESISRKIIRNTIFNAIGRFWGILVALVLTPYIIHHIGIERYGIWALVGALTGYFGLLDFGIGTSFVKYLAEFYAKKDYEKINQVVNTGFVFYTIFAVIIIALGFFAINPLLSLLKIPSSLYNEAKFVFLLGIVIFSISNALSPFSAVQSGLQRMDITNKVVIAISIPNILGTIFFLKKGYGLPGLMVNNAIMLFISSIVNITIAFKILPELSFNPFLFTKKIFEKLFAYGWKLQITRVAGLFQFQMDKILLAYFLNIGFVTYYEVASNPASKSRELPLMLISAILPAASELDAKADKTLLYELYFRSVKYVALIGIPISIISILLSQSFMNLWLGEGYEISALTLQILMVGYLFNLITGPGFFILNGMGKPQYAMRSSILSILLSIVLNIVLVIKIGYLGVVIGTTTTMIIISCYFLTIAQNAMEIPTWKILLEVISKPIIAGTLSAAITYPLIKQIVEIGWGGFIGIGMLYIIVFSFIILLTNYFDDFDKSLANKYCPFFLFKTKAERRNP